MIGTAIVGFFFMIAQFLMGEWVNGFLCAGGIIVSLAHIIVFSKIA